MLMFKLDAWKVGDRSIFRLAFFPLFLSCLVLGWVSFSMSVVADEFSDPVWSCISWQQVPLLNYGPFVELDLHCIVVGQNYSAHIYQCEYSDRFLGWNCVCNCAASVENWEVEQFSEPRPLVFLLVSCVQCSLYHGSALSSWFGFVAFFGLRR